MLTNVEQFGLYAVPSGVKWRRVIIYHLTD
jgi:hypothetical protein